MAEQFWIGGFYIDLSRNQIRQNGQTQTLAPKALAVLTHLAQNHGNVVSQEELLDKVWQGTVVSPNTLQRSIAQLRKALGDDGKVQVYIKTHAKKGYSLECDVHWQEQEQPDNTYASETSLSTAQSLEKPLAPNKKPLAQDREPLAQDREPLSQNQEPSATNREAERENKQTNSKASLKGNQTHTPNKTRISKWPVVTFSFLACILLFSYLLVNTNKQNKLSIVEFRALTATDKKEFGGAYSLQGQYVVFSRYENLLCQNNIWAKDLNTQQEYQLTETAGAYSGHAFSKDGETLIFIKEQDCTKPLTQKKCFTLMSLDFTQSLNSKPFLNELMECKNSAIKSPAWLNNNNIALLQKTSKRWRLISYSMENNDSQVLFEEVDGNVLDFAYSPEQDLIAVTSVNANDDYILNMLSADGRLVSSNKITLPEEVAKFRYIRPNFSGSDQQLIFSTGRQLFTLSYSGDVSKISLPIDRPMGTPILHPSGQRMMVVTGFYDADIIAMSLDPSKHSQLQPEQRVLARSTAGEYNAMLQPSGELVAFKSKRSGEDQVWLTSDSGTRQLTQFPTDSYIMGMDWADDGQSLLVNVNNQLVKVPLAGNIENIAMANSVDKLFYWDSENNKALALLRIKGVSTFVEIDLNRSSYSVVNDKSVAWAAKTTDGQLIYTDHLDRFWLQGAIEDQLIESLSEHGSDIGAIIKQDVIYGANKSNQLWTYNIKNADFKIAGRLPENLDHLTDMSGNELYGVIRVSAKKELAELFVKK